MSEHSEAPIHPHAGLPSALWSAGVPQADRQSPVHGQARWLPRGYAVAGRAPGCAPSHHQLFEEVSVSSIKLFSVLLVNRRLMTIGRVYSF